LKRASLIVLRRNNSNKTKKQKQVLIQVGYKDQYSNMALSGQTSISGGVFFVSKSLLEGTKRRSFIDLSNVAH